MLGVPDQCVKIFFKKKKKRKKEKKAHRIPSPKPSHTLHPVSFNNITSPPRRDSAQSMFDTVQPLATAFQYVSCKKSGPRQGKDMRLCVCSRERMPKSLLWRLVRVRQPDGTTIVTFNEGYGRSAYVSKDLESVTTSLKRKKLSRALKMAVPHDIQGRLTECAAAWDRVPPAEKGLLFCEVYGEEGIFPAVEEVQSSLLVEDFDAMNSYEHCWT